MHLCECNCVGEANTFTYATPKNIFQMGIYPAVMTRSRHAASSAMSSIAPASVPGLPAAVGPAPAAACGAPKLTASAPSRSATWWAQASPYIKLSPLARRTATLQCWAYEACVGLV